MSAGYYLNTKTEAELLAAVLIGVSDGEPSLDSEATADRIVSNLIDLGLVNAEAAPATQFHWETISDWSTGDEQNDYNTLVKFYIQTIEEG